MNRRRLIVFLLLSLCFSADAQYRVSHWTVEEGLPQNTVRGIAQTPDGYLWIATLDGLVRFDGVRFTVFNRSNTPGIISNRFAGMDLGRNGDLWLYNEIGGATRYHAGAFRTYGRADGMAGSVVNGAAVNESGDLWILSGNRLEQWNESAERFDHVTPPGAKLTYQSLLWGNTGFWAGMEPASAVSYEESSFLILCSAMFPLLKSGVRQLTKPEISGSRLSMGNSSASRLAR